MSAITKETSVAEVVRQCPEARRIFDEHGLRGCGGSHGPAESLEFFASVHQVNVEQLVRELNDELRKPSKPYVYQESLPDFIYRRFFKAGIAIVLSVGGLWGAVNLAQIALGGTFLQARLLPAIHAHAHAMIFGWVGLFVMGFAYQSFPRFKNTNLWRPELANASFYLSAPAFFATIRRGYNSGMPEPRRADHAQTLRKVAIFSGLEEHELQFLAQRAVPRQYSPGEMIFSEGDPCGGLYVVESGNVRIFKSSATGREQVLAIEGAGSSIAELPVFDGGNYPASTSAVTDSTLLFVSKNDFQALCLEHPRVALKVLRVVGARLRRLVGIIEELSFTTVHQRLSAFLCRLAATGKRTPAGIEITLPSSNQELAAQIGTVRELVSRNLSRLQAQGLIQMDGRQVVIPDLQKLQAEAESGE